MRFIILFWSLVAAIVASISYTSVQLGDWGSDEWFYKTMTFLTVGLLVNIVLGLSIILSKMEKK